MPHYFLRADFDALNARIDEVKERIRALGREMGESCGQSSETFHDNFAFEDGERNQRMWSEQLRRLLRLRDDARLVDAPARGERVGIGRRVTVLDLDRGELRTFRVGSYMRLAESAEDTVSYQAPLARLLVGAEVGEVREGPIRGRLRSFEVIEVK